jgi:hypothetical protein
MQKHVKTIATGNALVIAFKRSIFIFGLIFTPMISKAQTECQESTPPKFDPEHEPRTLCQKYSPPGKFPNRFGKTETHFASQIIWNLNNGSDVFTGDIDLVGELIIDQDFTLLNCKVRISPTVRIRVEADVTFTLDGSKLFCCQDMWQGIDLDYRSTVISRNITEIEDAMVAMESPCTATMSIRNTTFNRNIVGIRLGYDGPVPWDPCATFPTFTQFAGNTFQCNAPLNGTTDGVSFVGVQVYKTNATIGALTSAFNTFRNIQFGVRFESQWWGTSAVNRCRFEGVLNDGIFMAQGNLRVERCIFLNNGFRGMNILETRGLVAQNNNFNYTDDVAPQASGNNIYRHIQAAGFALNAAVDINHNFFGGNFSDPEKTEHLRGIEMVGGATMGGGTNIRVDWNNFNFSVAQLSNTWSSEVYLTGEYPSTTSTIIQFNDFFIDHPIENLNGAPLYGILLANGTKNQFSIYSNTFDSGSWGPLSSAGYDVGMYLWGSIGGGNHVSGNIFTYNPSTAFSNNFFTGIYSQDFTNTVFCANDLRESVYPMYFRGMSMGTQHFVNTHTGGGNSFRVEDGFIGEQGIEGGEHNGNKWYDKWINIIPTWHAYCWPPENAQDSRIWAHTAQSVRNTQGLGYAFFSEYHPADIDPNQMDEWFKPDPTGFPGERDCIDHITGPTETDRAIAVGTINLTGFSTAHAWTAKRYLYAKLMQNPGLQGIYAEFGPFLASESNTSVGQLYAVEEKIAEGLKVSASLAAQLSQIKTGENLAISELFLADSIMDTSTNAAALTSAQNGKNLALGELRRLDSLYSEINTAYQAVLMSKLQEALALNNAVTAAKDYEQHEKTVNDIAIRRELFQNGELTAAQVAVLTSIAAECPKTDGHGVYRARGLLTGCNEGNWSDDYTGCYPIAPPVQEQVLDNSFGQRSDKKQLTIQALAYPNPASEGIFVRTLPDQYGQIILQDMTGSAWREAQFTLADEAKYLDLSGVPSGVYICTVSGSNGKRQVIKVFVVKP